VDLQEKLVENREEAHAESMQREDIELRGEEVLPEPAIEAVVDAGIELRGELLGAIRMLLDREPLSISSLHLPQRELQALEAVQIAVGGRGRLGEYVYASDRRDMLEQALAVLQPDLLHADDQSARELRAQFDDLSHRVGELREQLSDLEDAQDELLESHHKAALEKGETEPGDKPKPEPKPSDPDAPRPASTLSGPELPPEPVAPSTLTGPEVREAPRPASTLSGPELPPEPAAASTLSGPELPPEPAAASTLGEPTGDAVGEAAGEAAKGKRSWWRRPFG
jgi:hypothetical protein